MEATAIGAALAEWGAFEHDPSPMHLPGLLLTAL